MCTPESRKREPVAPGAAARRYHSDAKGSVSHRAVAAQAHRGQSAVVRALLAALASLVLLLATGCGTPATSSPSQSTGINPSSNASGETPSTSAPVQRALLALIAYHRYAFSVTTWDTSQAQSPMVFQIEGVMVDPWTYLSISGPGLQDEVEVVYQSQVAQARVGKASAWRSAAEVFGSVAGLAAAPIENPEPLKELVPGIATMARPATEGAPPPPAPLEPDGATSYEWQTALTEGDTEMATVHNRIWLNGNGVIVRWDRRLTPTTLGGQFVATYSSITYSRHGDASLSIPAQGYETGDAPQAD